MVNEMLNEMWPDLLARANLHRSVPSYPHPGAIHAPSILAISSMLLTAQALRKYWQVPGSNLTSLSLL